MSGTFQKSVTFKGKNILMNWKKPSFCLDAIKTVYWKNTYSCNAMPFTHTHNRNTHTYFPTSTSTHGLHNYMYHTLHTKLYGPACLCFVPTVLTGSSESHILLSLTCLVINDTCCQHLRLRVQRETTDSFLLPMILSITYTRRIWNDRPRCRWCPARPK